MDEYMRTQRELDAIEAGEEPCDVPPELARQKPWLVAEGESWWLITGHYKDGGTFTNCFAEVVPKWALDEDGLPVFQMTIWGGETHLVSADQISHARRLLLVLADDPLTAYHDDEQDYIDAALARRDEETRDDA